MANFSKSKLLRTTTATLIAGATLAGAPSFAQTAPATAPAPAPAPAAEAEADSGQAIVVTGTRISRPDLASTVPIAIVSGETFTNQGNTNVGDTLNDFPQLRASRGQQNPVLGVGIAGLNLLDLRGLGSQRTLVLVNGRRHVGADILNNAVSVDINTIPANIIDRVDIVTGGNSSIYGSDAIAGVVNFILRKDFDGIEVSGKAGISTPGGFGANYHLDALYGKNFADGRGNIMVSMEYNRQNRAYASDAPWLRRVDGLVVTDLDGGGLAQNSDGIFDRTFQYDIRSASTHYNGLVPITYTATTAQCGIGIGGTGGSSPVAAQAYNCNYIFQPDGSLVAQTGTRISQGIQGTFIGGNGQTGREGDLYTLLPKQQIYNANLIGHYEFSPAFDVFVEAKYARIISDGGNAGPSGINGTPTLFDYRERVRLDNPFLTPGQRTQIANAILASGCNPNISTVCTGSRSANAGGGISGPLNAADITAINNGSYRFAVARILDDVGPRDEHFTRQTYRGVIGARGTFNTDWKYEVALNYGRFTEKMRSRGYVDKQRFDLAMDAGRNPLTNAIECRAKFDPASAVAAANVTSPENTAAKLAADIAACVPYNPFGARDNAASIAYFSTPYFNNSWMTQLDISGFVAGDTSGLIDLPGGPIDFVLGGEYRREDNQYMQDMFAANGNTTAVAFGSFEPTPFKVAEAFTEVHLPLLRDLPAIKELNLSGAARVSDYNSGAGTVWTWNGGGDWSPVSGLRFRANYSRSVRAPNVTETFGKLVPNFAPGFTDPCSGGRINSGSQYRAANCATDLGAALLAQISALGSKSLPILSGVNPDLEAEKSNSFTFGAVFQPRFVRGLTVTADYYDITVDGVITSLAAQDIANSCYDQPTLNNQFCALFSRNRTGNTDSKGQGPGEIASDTLISAPLNFAKRKRRGFEIQADYRTTIFGDVRFQTHLLYSHTIKNSNYENPNDPTFENRLLGELGDPKDEVRLNLDFNKGPFTFGYETRYIGPMTILQYENVNPLQDRPPQDSDYSDISHFPRVFYHDVRFEWDLEKSGVANGVKFFAGVDNVLNRKPPLGSTGSGGSTGGGANERPASSAANAAIYSVRGRQFYAGFRASF